MSGGLHPAVGARVLGHGVRASLTPRPPRSKLDCLCGRLRGWSILGGVSVCSCTPVTRGRARLCGEPLLRRDELRGLVRRGPVYSIAQAEHELGKAQPGEVSSYVTVQRGTASRALQSKSHHFGGFSAWRRHLRRPGALPTVRGTSRVRKPFGSQLQKGQGSRPSFLARRRRTRERNFAGIKQLYSYPFTTLHTTVNADACLTGNVKRDRVGRYRTND